MHPKSYNFWGAYFYRMIFIWNLQIIPRLSSIFPKWYNEVQSTATRCN